MPNEPRIRNGPGFFLFYPNPRHRAIPYASKGTPTSPVFRPFPNGHVYRHGQQPYQWYLCHRVTYAWNFYLFPLVECLFSNFFFLRNQDQKLHPIYSGLYGACPYTYTCHRRKAPKIGHGGAPLGPKAMYHCLIKVLALARFHLTAARRFGIIFQRWNYIQRADMEVIDLRRNPSIPLKDFLQIERAARKGFAPPKEVLKEFIHLVMLKHPDLRAKKSSL